MMTKSVCVHNGYKFVALSRRDYFRELFSATSDSIDNIFAIVVFSTTIYRELLKNKSNENNAEKYHWIFTALHCPCKNFIFHKSL